MDPIADMLTRIRNAQAVEKETVEIPFSRIKYAIAKIMEQRGFIKKADFRGRKEKKFLVITLRYRNGQPVVHGLKRVSKQGQRIYSSAIDIKRTGREGIAIVSTSQGIMTDREARTKNVGGEILCEVW